MIHLFIENNELFGPILTFLCENYSNIVQKTRILPYILSKDYANIVSSFKFKDDIKDEEKTLYMEEINEDRLFDSMECSNTMLIFLRNTGVEWLPRDSTLLLLSSGGDFMSNVTFSKKTAWLNVKTFL